MKVMVTGAAGYIGQPLTEMLHTEGHEVLGVDIRPAQHTTEGDIRDLPDHLFEGVDSIVHLAGVSFAPEWTDADDIIWDANVEGVRRVLDQAEQAGVRRFVLAPSASIFEGRSDDLARADTRPRPVSAYGRSKACAERAVTASAIPQKVALRKGTLCGLGPNPFPRPRAQPDEPQRRAQGQGLRGRHRRQPPADAAAVADGAQLLPLRHDRGARRVALLQHLRRQRDGRRDREGRVPAHRRRARAPRVHRPSPAPT